MSKLTLVVVHLGRIAPIKHVVEFDNVGITWVPLEHVSSAIKAQEQSVRWLSVDISLTVRVPCSRVHRGSVTSDTGKAAATKWTESGKPSGVGKKKSQSTLRAGV